MTADSIKLAIENHIARQGRLALAEKAKAVQAATVSEIQADGSLSDELKTALVRTVGMRVSGSGVASYAKVGFGVAGAGGGRSIRSGKNSTGVGISARNVHWFAMGTVDRQTGAKSVWGKKRKTGNRVRFSGRIQPIRILMRVKGRF